MQAALAWVREPGRIAALVVLAFAAALQGIDPYLLRELRVRGFDAMQRLWPQPPASNPVVIIDIDEESLKKDGQWPWPRTLVAQLIDRIAAGQPRVLGIDVLFPEPDRLSPNRLAKFLPDLPPAVAAALAALPSSEMRLAQAIGQIPTVLSAAPSDEEPPAAAAGPHRAAPILQKGGPPTPFLTGHKSMIRSLPELTAAARGEGSIGGDADSDGVVRSVPLIGVAEGRLAPAFALEALRIAIGAAGLVVTTESRGIATVTVGDFSIPTDAHGRAYLHFEPPLPRYISAADLFGDDFDARQLKDRIVLLGVSGLGTVDQKNTPLGVVLGTEIHAQLIESVLAGTVLSRPPSVFWIELGLVIAAGLAVIGLLPYDRPLLAGAGMLGIAAILVGIETGLFRFAGWLIDDLFATGATLLVFGAMLGGNFVAEQRERHRLAAELEREREAKARFEGELAAARAIQMGLLPHHFPAFPGRSEIDLYARIEPARDVGGDLFDFLLIDRNRLFFMIGDVSGKGIPAALFMAMTKEVMRDAAAQHGTALELLLATANRKIGDASDNLAADGADMMFVTAFAGFLDLVSGDLIFASAGHDSPLVIKDGKELRELATEGGPPLGVVEDFAYPLSRDRLDPGAILLLYTDGVTEAQDASGALYGGQRLAECLSQSPAADARAAIDLVFDDLRRFVGAVEQFDDITLLAVRRPARAA